MKEKVNHTLWAPFFLFLTLFFAAELQAVCAPASGCCVSPGGGAGDAVSGHTAHGRSLERRPAGRLSHSAGQRGSATPGHPVPPTNRGSEGHLTEIHSRDGNAKPVSLWHVHKFLP